MLWLKTRAATLIAAAEALREMGAVVSESSIASPVYCGDGYYTLRAGDGKANGALPSEAIVLLRADFASAPVLVPDN